MKVLDESVQCFLGDLRVEQIPKAAKGSLEDEPAAKLILLETH